MQKLALTLLGVIPILMAIIWIDGNMTLPGETHRLFQDKLGWPWLSFQESSVITRALLDLALSVMAYLPAFLAIAGLKTPQMKRVFPISVLGVSLFCAMSCWQYTGIIIWSFRVPLYSSDLLYGAFAALTLYVAYSDRFAPSKLKTPPLTTLLPLSLAFLFTPIMSLDRLLFSLVTIIFLMFLIKYSELSIANGP